MGTFMKLSNLIVKLVFSNCISIYFSIIRVRINVIKRLFITTVTQVHGRVTCICDDLLLRLRH